MTENTSTWNQPKNTKLGLKKYIKLYGIKKDKWGRLILYKRVLKNRASDFAPYRGRVYLDRAEVSVYLFSEDEKADCDPGLHVATRQWADDYWRGSSKHITLEVRVWPKDVVAVPLTQSYIRVTPCPKIRVRKLYVQGLAPYQRVL